MHCIVVLAVEFAVSIPRSSSPQGSEDISLLALAETSFPLVFRFHPPFNAPSMILFRSQFTNKTRQSRVLNSDRRWLSDHTSNVSDAVNLFYDMTGCGILYVTALSHEEIVWTVLTSRTLFASFARLKEARRR